MSDQLPDLGQTADDNLALNQDQMVRGLSAMSLAPQDLNGPILTDPAVESALAALLVRLRLRVNFIIIDCRP